MAAKAKETGNIDFTTFTASFWFISKWEFPHLPLFHLSFLSIWFNADSGNLTFFRKMLYFQGFFMSSSLSSVPDLGQKGESPNKT